MGVPLTPTGLRARLADGVRFRPEPFGMLAYVARRDHFYALDQPHAALLDRLSSDRQPSSGWCGLAPEDRAAVRRLAAIGVVATDPPTAQRAFFGQSLVGSFPQLPTPSQPMVVNCFATSHCPLRCRYCHADDLMAGVRDNERDDWIDRVIRTADAVPAMVGVVTGGEPLSRIRQAERLIAALAATKSVVLDTSGVGEFERLVPVLRRYGVHVRVSLDSAAQRVNDALRPINRRYLPLGASSHGAALAAIRTAVAEGIPCSAQTVVSSRNRELAALLELRDLLVDAGVTTWVLHVIVRAGKAARADRAGLLCGDDVLDTLREVVKLTADAAAPLDVRVTSTHRVPNSALLVNAEGALCVEAPEGGRKISWRYLDAEGHASRYLNGTLEPFPQPIGAVFPG